MKKEAFIFLLVLTLISSALLLDRSQGTSSEDFNVYVHNVTEFVNLTHPDARISGKINLTFSGLEKGSFLSSNQGDSVDFFNFSKNNNYAITCSPLDCLNGYDNKSDGNKSLNLTLDEDETKIIGLKIPPTNNEIEEITTFNFEISSNFSEGDSCPLEIIFLGEDFEYREIWRFSEFSTTGFSEKDYASYNSTKTKEYSTMSSNYKYCTKYDFEDLRNLKAGIILRDNRNDTKFIKMELYDGSTSPISSCLYNPNTNDSCTLEVTQNDIDLSISPYYVCATSNSSSTNYEILEESQSLNLSSFSVGSTFYLGDLNKNYALFIQKAKYANASKINNSEFTNLNLEGNMNYYLYDKYQDNCSKGCIIPIEIHSNVAQKLKFEVESFQYSVGNAGKQNNSVYLLEKTPAKISFSGVIDLSKTNFKIRNEGDYILSLGEKRILNEEVEFKESYRIQGVVPRDDIPANTLVGLYAIIKGAPLNLTYTWKFDDNVTLTSQENYVERIFDKPGVYGLNLSVKDKDGVDGFNEFSLAIVNATFDVLNRSYNLKKAALENAKENLNEFSQYKTKIEELGNFSYYSTSLGTIKYHIDNYGNESLKTIPEILTELNQLDVPKKINIVNNKNIEYFPYEDRDSINGSLVAKKGNINATSTEIQKYESEILAWEQTYIQSQIISKDIVIEDVYGTIKPILTEYIVNAYSSYPDGDSYLVVDTSGNNLFILNSSSATKTSYTDSVFIKFNNKPVNFYILNKDNPNPKFFFTTDIENYNIADTNLICNNNGACEKDRGENFQNCRYDCRPLNLIAIWLVVISLLGVGIFFGLRFWFKNNYEKKLFSNPRDLVNLMRFVRNAKENKFSRSQIKKELLEAGWSIERINYAIKKSFKAREGLDLPQNSLKVSDKKGKGRNINKSKKTS